MAGRITPELAAEARRLAAEGVCLAHVAARLGVHPATLYRWKLRHGVTFADGRPEKARANLAHGRTLPQTKDAARRNIAKAHEARVETQRLPITGAERAAYDRFRDKASKAGVRVTRADAMRAIGRADLVGEAA